ncbi:hypothetical protein ES288_D01G094900v1, partial [Gossypium darwinii]
FYIGPPLGLRPQPSPFFLSFILLNEKKKNTFLNPCFFPLDRRHSLFAPSPDFCFAGVAIVSTYNRFHQQAASIASKLAHGMFSDLGSNQSCSGLSD